MNQSSSSSPARLFTILHIRFLAVVVAAALSLSGCAHRNADSIVDSDLELTVTLDRSLYLPGEAVVCTVALGNRSSQDLQTPTVDHESLTFSLIPVGDDGAGLDHALRKRPVFSELEPTGRWTALDAGSTITRTLVFTNVTFYPGRYLLSGHYQAPDTATPGAMRRVFARSASFTVADEEPAIRRYLNGLMAREEAIARAVEAEGGDARQAQARLILDERGFHKWWVNVPVENATDADPVRSCFVDPYFGKVWPATQPFQEEEDVPMPFPEESLRRQRYSGEE